MEETVIINNKIFKKYDNMYFVSADGEVYSTFSKKILKNSVDTDGYIRVDIHSKHIKVHKLVYITWIGKIPENTQINHKDDNKLNNHYTNLYAGTQKDNIQDKIDNGHGVGHIYYLTILDKKMNKLLTFCPAKEFISYSRHSCNSGSINKMMNKKWFKESYDVIEFKKIANLEQFLQLKGVSTIPDECKGVRAE